jgi:hypothetical protein
MNRMKDRYIRVETSVLRELLSPVGNPRMRSLVSKNLYLKQVVQ